MCESSGSLAGLLWLTISNVFYLLAFAVAVYRKHFYLASILAGVTFFSTAYHLCAAEWVCLGGASCRALRLLDYIFAYYALAEFTLFVFLYRRLREGFWPLAHYLAVFIAVAPAWLLIADDLFKSGVSTDISWRGAAWLGGALAVFGLLMWGLRYRSCASWRSIFRWKPLGAIVLGVAAVVLFVLDDSEVSPEQDVIHGFWHTLGALAACLLLWAVSPRATLDELVKERCETLGKPMAAARSAAIRHRII